MFGAKQKGLSPFGVMLVVLNFALFVVVGLKMVPAYMTYGQVKSIFEEKYESAGKKSAAQLKKEIEKQLTVSAIQSDQFSLRDSGYFQGSGENLVIGFEYEIEEKLFGNVRIVMDFKYDSSGEYDDEEEE